MRPVSDVVTVDEAAIRASGEATSSIAQPQCPPERGGNGAALPADIDIDIEHTPSLGGLADRSARHDGRDQPTIARNPTKRLGREQRPVLEESVPVGIRPHQALGEVNQDAIPVPSRFGAARFW